MKAQIFSVKEEFPGRLAIVMRPRGGEWLEDETAAWSNAGLNIIVSMLEPEEVQSFNLEDEGEFCQSEGIEFISFPVTDRSVPAIDGELLNLLDNLRKKLLQGKNIGIHCRQSIGRAPLLAAVLMIAFGFEPDEAFRQLSDERGVTVPETIEQKEWAERFYEQTAVAAF